MFLNISLNINSYIMYVKLYILFVRRIWYLLVEICIVINRMFCNIYVF